MARFVLVRSPRELVEDNLIGYGWGNVNFSKFTTAKDLIAHFNKNNIDYRRQKNQIRRFFNISEGDVVIVPMGSSFAIGHATNTKSYGSGIRHGDNRIAVNFLRNNDGKLIKIPNKRPSTGFASRLKIRQTVASLDEFEDEIMGLLQSLEKYGAASLDLHVQELQETAIQQLKSTLLSNIRSGKSYLESGGIGLERLVQELLQIEGYQAKIPSKSQHEGIADTDIEAVRTDRFSSTRLIIQVKHHQGMTGTHGIKQLNAVEEEENVLRWLITTASVSDEVKAFADSCNVQVMDGELFVEWLYEHLGNLSPMTLNRLGVALIPTLLN